MQEASDAQAIAYYEIASSVAAAYAQQRGVFGDVIDDGASDGLSEALTRFDPDGDYNFEQYLVYCVRKWVSIHIKRAARRSNIDQRLHERYAERLSAMPHREGLDGTKEYNRSHDLNRILEEVDPQERDALRLWSEGCTCREIGGLMGLSKSVAHRLVQSGLQSARAVAERIAT